MKNIILKISLLLIASSFSTQLFPAAAAAKEKTGEEVTPDDGPATAEKSLSPNVKYHNDFINKILESIKKKEKKIAEDVEDLNEYLKALQTSAYLRQLDQYSGVASIKKSSIDLQKAALESANKNLLEWNQALKKIVEAERLAREKQSEKTE